MMNAENCNLLRFADIITNIVELGNTEVYNVSRRETFLESEDLVNKH